MQLVGKLEGGTIWLHEDYQDGRVRLGDDGRWRVAADYGAARWAGHRPGDVKVRNIGIRHDADPDNGTWIPMWMRAA